MKSGSDIPPPEKAAALDPAEFSRAYELVARASMRIAAMRRAGLGGAGGDDTSVTRDARGAVLGEALAPLRERYGNDTAEYHSAAYRVTALARLLRSPHLRGWVRVTKEGVAAGRAVLAAAAVVPLTSEGEFPVAEFLREVERRAARKPR